MQAATVSRRCSKDVAQQNFGDQADETEQIELGLGVALIREVGFVIIAPHPQTTMPLLKPEDRIALRAEH